MIIEKIEKPVANLLDRTEYVIHLWNLKVRTNRDIKLKDNRKKKKLLGIRTKSSYYKVFQKKFVNKWIEKAVILRKKRVCLALSILELSKILMFDFCYDYVKPNYGENPKISCVQADSFKTHVKTDGTYKDIEDVETRFDNSNYKLDRPLSKGKNKKVIDVTKDELGKKICWIKTKNL